MTDATDTAPVEPPTAVVGASTVDGRDDAFDAVATTAATVAVVLVPDSGADVVSLRDRGVRSVVVADWVAAGDGTLPAGVVVGLTVDRAQQLRAVIEAARTPESPQVSLLRLGDGVLGAVAGTEPGANDAVARVLAAVAAADAPADAAADGDG